MFENLNDEMYHTVEQIKRYESAVNTVFPVSVDLIRQAAVFLSSSDSLYNTTLHNCSCMDFSVKLRPCKHMYRLAIECGIINPNEPPWKEYKNYSKLYKKAKKKLDKMDVFELQELLTYLENNK